MATHKKLHVESIPHKIEKDTIFRFFILISHFLCFLGIIMRFFDILFKKSFQLFLNLNVSFLLDIFI